MVAKKIKKTKKLIVTDENFELLLLESAKQAADHAEGKITLKSERIDLPENPPEYDQKRIKKIREDLNISQPVLAAMMGCTGSAVKAWELGTNKPNGPARRLFQIMERNPDLFVNSISASGNKNSQLSKKKSKKTAKTTTKHC